MEDKKHISPSQIKIYLQCGRKYFYKYVEERKPLRIHSSILFGRAFHSAIAEFNIMRKCRKENPSGVLSLFRENLKREMDSSETSIEMESSMDEMRDTGEKMLNLYMDFLRSLKTNVLEVEVPVEYPIDDTDYIFKGVIDSIEENKEDVDVVEVKTSSRGWAVDTHTYNLQVPFYRDGVRMNYPDRNVRIRYDVLTKGKVPKIISRVSDGKINLYKDVLIGVIKGIENGIFIPKPGYHCRYCGYREICMEDRDEEVGSEER